jgi:hypothetical protein
MAKLVSTAKLMTLIYDNKAPGKIQVFRFPETDPPQHKLWRRMIPGSAPRLLSDWRGPFHYYLILPGISAKGS